jgi:hypothetical protein
MSHLKQIIKIAIFKNIKCHNEEKIFEDSFKTMQQNTTHKACHVNPIYNNHCMVCGDLEKVRRKDHELEGLRTNFSIFKWFSMKLHILSYNV